jgi:hypothetical protein
MQVYLVPDLVKPSPEVERLASGIFDSLADVAKHLEETFDSPKPANSQREA